jgi:hypothetical protein
MGIRPADKTGQEALLSEDRYLLRQIGIFFHGEEWQAPLARDLHVSERTMRRWVAGTEDIPRGVWRDLSAHLETYTNARISCNSGKAHRWPDPDST